MRLYSVYSAPLRRSAAPTVDRLRIAIEEIDAAVAEISEELMQALDLAASRIEAFHRLQVPTDIEQTDAAGLRLGMRWRPLDAVGLYVPGGKAAIRRLC